MYPKLLEFIVAALLVVGAWFYAGHQAVEEYKEAQKIEQAESDKRQQEKYDTLAESYETLRTKRESDAKVIVKQVEKVIAGDVVYRNICISNDGLSVANAAISGKSPGVPDAALPASESP